MKNSLLCFVLMLMVSVLGAAAQSKYTFTCDAYENGQLTYSGVPGKFLVHGDSDGWSLFVLVDQYAGQKSGKQPFGWWTDYDSQSYIKHYDVHPYDDSLHDVYYIMCDDDEICIAVVYSGGSPAAIRMLTRYRNNTSHIDIPYSEAARRGVYGVINAAKKRIDFEQY